MNNHVDILQVQKVLFAMATSIKDILERNRIPYIIAYGTLLGAVRGEDFIPWDDDFDFYLFDDTYDTAIRCLRRELPEEFFVEDQKSEPLYFHAWAHVKDMKSVAVCDAFPQDSLYAHKGISVDLYRTRKMPLHELEGYLNSEAVAYIQRRKNKGLISDSEYTERMNKLRKKVEIPQDTEMSDEAIYNLLPTDHSHFMRACDVFPLKQYMFHGELFYGPKNADLILSEIYGDYMQFPPEEERRGHYSSVKFL